MRGEEADFLALNSLPPLGETTSLPPPTFSLPSPLSLKPRLVYKSITTDNFLSSSPFFPDFFFLLLQEWVISGVELLCTHTHVHFFWSWTGSESTRRRSYGEFPRNICGGRRRKYGKKRRERGGFFWGGSLGLSRATQTHHFIPSKCLLLSQRPAKPSGPRAAGKKKMMRSTYGPTPPPRSEEVARCEQRRPANDSHGHPFPWMVTSSEADSGNGHSRRGAGAGCSFYWPLH